MDLKAAAPNALLGLLSLYPMSGYDIRQAIPETIGHFWSESYGNIYPALKLLTAKGLVTKQTERQKGKPDRHVHSLTEAGREQLAGWLEVPLTTVVPKNELLLKLFFGAHAPTAVSRDHVLRYREFHSGAEALYTTMARKLEEGYISDLQLPFWLMTLNYGRRMCAATVAWCDETLTTLDSLPKPLSTSLT